MQKPKHNLVTHGNCEHLKSGILSKEVRWRISIFVVANFVKGEECGDHCCFVHPRKQKANNLRLHYEGNDMLSSDKLRYFDFTTNKMRLGIFLSFPIYSNSKGKRQRIFLFLD